MDWMLMFDNDAVGLAGRVVRDVFKDNDRLTAERDEAREWAGKLDARVQELERSAKIDNELIGHQIDALASYLEEVEELERSLLSHRKALDTEKKHHGITQRFAKEAEKELEELQRKYKQATCEHGNSMRLNGRDQFIPYSPEWNRNCPDCGKEME